MTTRTFEIVNGQPIPDAGALDGPTALQRKGVVQARLGEIRGDASKDGEREALKRENEALDVRLRAYRDEVKQANVRRTFAGIGTPLHEAIVARFDPSLVAELEAEALAKLAERERRSAERKAGKGS